MTTFRKTPVTSEIYGDEPLSASALGYLNERVRNSFYDYVLRRFYEAVKQEKLTKARLARRLGLEPARVTRLLGSPGNWTLDTISELLVGICREELRPQSEPYLERSARNFQSDDLRQSLVQTQGSRRLRSDEEMMGPQLPYSGALMEMGLRKLQVQAARLPTIAESTR